VSRTAVWFRRDLRTADNTALRAACAEASAEVVGLYIVSPGDFRRHDEAACKVDFVLRSLRELSADLARLNIPLLVETAKTPAEVPKVVAKLLREQQCESAHCNREYEVNEQARDRDVERRLAKAGIALHAHHDTCLLAPGDVLTKKGTCSTVFTPFRKAFLRRLEETGLPAPKSKPRKRREMITSPSTVPEQVAGFKSDIPTERWPAGEREAKKRLNRFVEHRIDRYARDRDRPDLEGTSTLSPYLALGCISARICLAAAWEANGGMLDRLDSGATTWISELIWRDFYKHILVAHPRLSKRRAFKPETEHLPWRNDETDFQAWCEGRTGFPIVDAAMRQLNQTGWMHNRLRMVTAMFLTKDLFLDWRLGERYFMQRLIDGDLSANNGGWQWSASTGTDAAPYFRIFNPESQSRKCDPEGTFIKRYLPELAAVPARDVHNPSPEVRRKVGYPAPIVDHKAARLRTIAAFKEAK
jgi:deoxyribodipyrimidine photo-lyase